MPVIDIMSLDMGSESGGSAEEDLVDTVVASSALTTDFGGIQETLGQLYAYRYNDTYVVLGTRSAITEDGAIQTAVGISEVANGAYHCSAENANATRNSSVAIQAVRGGHVHIHTCAAVYVA